MKRKEFDPLKYIEDAFLDKSPAGRAKSSNGGVGGLDVAIPTLDGYIHSGDGAASKGRRGHGKFRKTKLSAPRPRKAKKASASASSGSPSAFASRS